MLLSQNLKDMYKSIYDMYKINILTIYKKLYGIEF